MTEPATADRTPEHDRLELDYEFEAPPEKVWRAVTIPALRERWLPDADLATAEPDTTVDGEEVRYRMRDPRPPFRESVVTFRLTPTPAGGTRVYIIHELGITQHHAAQALHGANSNDVLMRAA
ncbi:SRPBCC family protein [Bradyrhizobium sp. 2TAF24]|uniref:SRPBCC family protein n=1 Tax=Bradyrhizobium sp. 2TAF24 TaxID=3233011 RepID=UPI003F91E0B6